MGNPPVHKARKRFGQNFLNDDHVIDKIVKSISPKPGQHLIEIGPGQGAITEPLLEALEGNLDVIELDRDLIPILKAKLFRHEGLQIHEADALKFDFASLASDGRPLRMVGNLPYNISTPLMFHLLEYSDIVEDMHFMLQKEVVQRLCAAPGDSAYGRLGIMMQYRCEARYLFTVPPGSFSPPPKVDSAIVRLTPRKELPYTASNFELFAQVVKAAFAQRRKTLRNNLKGMIDDAGLEALGINPGIRAEMLGIEAFVNIANAIDKAA
ncbi:16S rRNA (adenine(1518)-N(6)/adenine(1519)-N(6))-dimethyltransferase RsmA [Reinekea marinisedimentorum]|uniref:Ribosomal RNA small subunit methyltransferase A n=1 Tax=Reinekea marinisedimentorum TaxID=230495 RepID=A0A4R3HWJ6_9GAMM|nr:16S rRNA (adenine(1518)-N(6)/adenine(1519)-N(6))-dimethyltransferase RsmA [Reinekea marinisedimentorum]TCS37154.1 16S rRNA (adenine1518-N6/adenine1519-N6)-dimethyltransferase [Reinekea marinisedimentorum]